MIKLFIVFILIVCSPLLYSSEDCSVGKHCELEGVLDLHFTPPEFTASLTVSNGCIPLALDPSFYERHKKINEKRVEVKGITYKALSAENLVTYELQGRHVGTLCNSEIILLVSEINVIND
ncbi:hypothetical protein [Kangiella marina]|uniref:Uncharacterized protein n=1 Tax=Kangiella marina TaxID=1079178 RepID=A0ABP8IEN4_9GAMM